jgi:hypothetical protein
VQKFDSEGEYRSQITTDLSNPVGVAVDPSGNLYVADQGTGAVEKFDASGAFVAAIGSGTSPHSVATDSAGDLFAFVSAPEPEVLEYSPAGAQIETIGAGSLGLSFGNPGIAFGDTASSLYVAQSEKSEAWVFLHPTPPTLGKELTADVGTAEAKLGALVGPGGLETSYQFEYDTREYREGEASHGQTAPIPAGNAGAGVQQSTVWATVFGLQPGTTYHYRVTVSNELGTVTGLDQTFTTGTPEQASCPNEQLRTGFSADLPDCRAYELVTPPNNLSAQPDPRFETGFAGNHASSDGDRLSYYAENILPGSQSAGWSYLATRGPDGWTSENLTPPQNGYYGFECDRLGLGAVGFATDLASVVIADGGNQVAGEGFFGGGCGSPGPELVNGEPRGVRNLFLRDNENDTYQLIDVTPPGVAPTEPEYLGGSSDLSLVVFNARAQLTTNAPGGVDLYAWSGGVVHLVSVLPDGTPVTGVLTGVQTLEKHVISADGSRVFFTAGGSLYVRENPGAEQSALEGERCTEPAKACTVRLDISQGSSGGGHFQEASADGSRVFFTDTSRLTADSTAEPSEPDLYECELPEETGGACKLTDLTVAKAGEHADVQKVIGASEDGSYVYFLAHGALSGSQANEHGETAQHGHGNLYLYHAGTITFIATLPENNGGCVTEGCSRVSPNGAFMAFQSSKSLTGYDNVNVTTGVADGEIFLYDAAANSLACASCNPSGQPPASNVGTNGHTGNVDGIPSGGAYMERRSGGAPHYLTDSGRLFFETGDALLPQDTNGQFNVYEFEPDGVGSCAAAGGCAYLISTGTDSRDSSFIDASANGNDVFLRQYQKLVPKDTQEEARTLYDARVDGGFPEPSVPPACTTADSCRVAPAPQPAIFGAPSSSTFSGAGNVAPTLVASKKTTKKTVKCKRGFVRKHNKCVKQKKAKKAKRASNKRRTNS